MRWQLEVTGFGTVFVLPGVDGGRGLGHLRWRKYADLLLVQDEVGSDSEREKGVGVSLSFLVGDVSDAAMAERLVWRWAEPLVRRWAELQEQPVTRAWNTREIVVMDSDGYRLEFFLGGGRGEVV